MLIDPDYVALHGGYDNERFIGISLINLGNGFVHANMPDATPPEKWIQLQPGKYGTWEPYTDAQISALVALVSELTSKYATIEYVNGHEDNKDGKNDPGPLFDEHWDKFLAFGLARGPRPASTRNRVV
jgi:N-acetyl-anhydromuramyl-L-alanine amidase AmpD